MHDFNDIKMSTSSLIDQTPKLKSIEWHKKFKIKYDNHFVHFIIDYKKIISVKSNKIQIFCELFYIFFVKGFTSSWKHDIVMELRK